MDSTLGTCVVTGATGFVGGVLTEYLESCGASVVRLVRKASRPSDVVVDLAHPTDIDLKAIGPRFVFHLAGRAHHYDRERQDQHAPITVGGTALLVEASRAAGAEAFVFFSSCAVMREGVGHVIDESDPPSPTSAYGRAKLAAERMVIEANDPGRMRTACLRMPLVYGRGHKGALPRMVDAVRAGWFPPLPKYAGKRSVVHVEDVARAALVVARDRRAAGQTYIVAEPEAYSSRQTYELILSALGRRVPSWHLPQAVLVLVSSFGDLFEAVSAREFPLDRRALRRLSTPAQFSGAKIERELGFVPTHTFRNAIQTLVAAESER